MKRVLRVLGLALLGAVVLVFLPVITLALLVYGVSRFWVCWRLKAAWPPNVSGFLAYSESELWQSRIEQQLIPATAGRIIPINRSKHDWKENHPHEWRALKFFSAGGRSMPFGLVIGQWLSVETFAFYEPFVEFKHGNERSLKEMEARFLARAVPNAT